MAKGLALDGKNILEVLKLDPSQVQKELRRMREKTPKKEPKQTCKLVFMENGVPTACGGIIETTRVMPPFTMHTVIGGPPERPIFSYRSCNKCGSIYAQK